MSKLLVFMSVVTSAVAVSEFYVECPEAGTLNVCYDFGTPTQSEYFAMPDYVAEFNNDQRLCDALTPTQCAQCSGYCQIAGVDSYERPYYCSDATAHVQQKFQDLVNYDFGNYDWFQAGTTGCCVRGGGGQITGNEYYRLACSCGLDSLNRVVPDDTWKVFYFAEDTCDTLVAESLDTYSGACGSASSVSVSLFASLVAVFAALKSM